jgi:putative transposase
MEGGKGYVFQSRFKSALIENNPYFIQSIPYLLRNPVRAGIVQLPEDYIEENYWQP